MIINPIHKCRIHCHTIDPGKMDVMGIDEDPGKWMAFALHMGTVVACKLASEEEDMLAYGCTTVFTETGDTYIIDTPYDEFEEKFYNYNSQDSSPEKNEPNF